jgi:alpha-beta hydrolase superfamily lysophospholipase
MYADQWLLIFSAIKQYKIDLQTTKLILMGRSFGGLIVTHMQNSTTGRSLFQTGLVLLAPCYDLWGDSLSKKLPALRVLQYIKPHHQFCTKSTVKGSDEVDPREVKIVTPITGLLMDSEMRLARDKAVGEIKVPILFIEAKDD